MTGQSGHAIIAQSRRERKMNEDKLSELEKRFEECKLSLTEYDILKEKLIKKYDLAEPAKPPRIEKKKPRKLAIGIAVLVVLIGLFFLVKAPSFTGLFMQNVSNETNASINISVVLNESQINETLNVSIKNIGLENITENLTSNNSIKNISLENKIKKIIPKTALDKLNDKFNGINFEKDKNYLKIKHKKAEIRLKGANESEIKEVQVASEDEIKIKNKKASFGTPVVAINSINITNATIILDKEGPVNRIVYCPDWNFTGESCSAWVETNIPFTDLGDKISFTVTHFTAYAGSFVTNVASEWDAGLFTNTEKLGNVTILSGANTTGTYLSYVYRNGTTANDAVIVDWTKLAWVDDYNGTTHYQEAPVRSGMVGYWKLNNNTLDSSTKHNNMTSYEATPTTECVFGTGNCAYDFGGTSSYMTALNSADFDFGTGDFTVEVWVYPTGDPSSMEEIINKADSTSYAPFRILRVPTGGGLNYLMSNTAGSWVTYGGVWYGDSAYAPLNKWTHIVLTRNSGTAHFYVNGVQVSSMSANYQVYNDASEVAIGRLLHYGTPYWFQGKIDNVIIYKDKGLTQDEVKEEYARGAKELNITLAYRTTNLTQEVYNTSGLLGWWKLDENATDFSGNGNNGNIVGAAKIGGYFNNSYMFDLAYLKYIDVGTGLNAQTVMTLEAWVNPHSGYSHIGGIISKYQQGASPAGSYYMDIDDALHPNYAFYGLSPSCAGSVTSYTFPTDKWTYYAITYDGSKVITYINGNDIDERACSGTITQSSATVWIGNLNQPAYYYNYYGKIDSARVYNRSLSAEEIKYNYWHANFTGRNFGAYKAESPATINQNAKYFQYKAKLVSNASGYTPFLEKTEANFSFTSGNTAPTQGTPKLNSTHRTNKSNENLTVYNTSTYDADGDHVTNIINWYRNGNSITALNMPFNSNNSAGAGKTKDYSGNGNNGTINGATWSATSGFDGKGAYSFDGTNDYITIPHSSSINIISGQATYSMWLKRGRSGATEVLFDKNSVTPEPVYIRFSNNDRIYIQIFANDGSYHYFFASSTSTITDTDWHLLDVVFDYDTWTNSKIYIDGVAETLYSPTQFGTQIALTNTGILTIGSPNSGADYNFNGKIDNVRIYNRALSAAQIKALYNNRTDRIVSQELNAGEIWKASITPNDGYADGLTKFSNNVTILSSANTAPTQGTPILNSTHGTNRSNENLTVYNTSTYDADGDHVTNIINWYRNGNSITALNMPFNSNNSAGAGKTKDYSGNGNNGTINGATWSATSGFDGKGAYSFDGSNDITVSDSSSLKLGRGSFTISLWLKTGYHGYQLILGKYNPTYPYEDYEISMLDASTIRGCAIDCGTSACGFGSTRFCLPVTFSIADNQWHYITYTRSGSLETFYIDGVSLGTLTQGPLNTDSTGVLHIGSTSFSGKIDNIIIYNRSLTAQEIKALYNNRTDRIVSQELNAGDIWKAAVTPNDGYTDGLTKFSNNITILSAANTAPTQGTPKLNSTHGTNRSNENLTVYNVSTYDAEGDPVTNIINWYKNGNSIMALNMPFNSNNSAGAGKTKDYSGHGNNGTVNGATWISNGGFDGKGAYSFDGSDYVSCGNRAKTVLNDRLTLEAWIKPTVGATSPIVGKDSQSPGWESYAMSLSTAGEVVMQLTNGATYSYVKSSGVVSNGVWSHVAVTWQYTGAGGMTDVSIYINGVKQTNFLVAQTGEPSTLSAATGDLRIGMLANQAYYFTGKIDNVRIYNRSLSAEQIKALYQNRTDRIVSQELNAGDIWKAAVTPNDGYSDGLTKFSNNVTIRAPAVANTASTQGTPILNSTHGTNRSNENLTVYNVSTYDAEGDPVTNIINWYRNGTSIAVLNMPFNSNNSAGAGKTKDYSGLGNNGTVNGAKWIPNGGFDGKGTYSFDGSGTYIDLGTGLNVQTEMTFEAWVMPHYPFPQIGAILSKFNQYGSPPGSYYFTIDGNLHPNYYIYGPACSGQVNSYTFPTEQWTHYAVTYNGSKAITYINGQKVDEISCSGAIQHSASSVWIGNLNQPAYYYKYFGKIDSVRLYNTSLSAAQIKALYQNRTDRIVSQELNAGDIWKAAVTPNDGYSDGLTKFSNNVTIRAPAVANTAPTQGTPILNSTHGTNRSNENLTVYNVSTYDAEGDPVTNIINWYRNGTSIAVLNMPFNSNNSAGAGKTKDYSGLGNNGTVNGATWNATAGFDGKGAYSFNGNTNNYISWTYTKPQNSFTMVAWVKATTTHEIDSLSDPLGGVSGEKYVFWPNHEANSSAGAGLSVGTNGITVYEHGDWYLPAVAEYIGNLSTHWHHIAIVYANKQPKIYLDGALVSTGGISTRTIVYAPTQMGSGSYGGFPGLIEDVRIYNSSLSAVEIKALYNNRTDRIVSQELNVGDIWKASITPNDGYSDGLTKFSNNITIKANIPPTQGTPILNSSKRLNRSNENLTVYNVSTYDADSDPVTNIINWYRNGNSIMVLNMPFNSNNSAGAGKTKDYSGHGNNGTVSGATWISDGGFDGKGAYRFNDSKSDFINLGTGSSLTIADKITLEAWIYLPDLTGYHPIISKQGYSVLRYNYAFGTSGANIYLWLDAEGGGTAGEIITTDNPITTTGWHHIVASYDGSYEAIYLDGVDVKHQVVSITLANSGTHACYIGREDYNTGISGLFNGKIDSARIYHRALTAQQIKALYNNRTDKIVSQELSAGDVWKASITPNDGYSDGLTKFSNNVTILSSAAANTPPTQGTPILNSTHRTNKSNENLTVYNVSTYDADSDPVTNIINWYRNGNSIMVLNMPFNSNNSAGAGKTKDYSGHGNNGTVDGATWSATAGFDGKGAYMFSSSYIERAYDPDFTPGTKSWTVAAWIKVPLTEGPPSFIADWYRCGANPSCGSPDSALYSLSIINNNKVNWHVRDDNSNDVSLTSSSAVADNNWHYIVGTFDPTNDLTKLYIDGAEVATNNTPLTSLSDGGVSIPLEIGRRFVTGWGSPSGYLYGKIDDVRIYSRALTAAQIKALYNNRTDRIDSQELKVGETWNASVTPNDGYADGLTEFSNSVTIKSSTPPNITKVQLHDKNKKPITNKTLVKAGENITINVTVAQTEGTVSSVWIKVWKTVANAFTTIFEGVLNLISGNLWQITITTNGSWTHGTNYTIYANDTTNIITSRNEKVFVNNLPTQGVPALSSLLRRNGTNENLTVYNTSTYDRDKDPVTNIINWYRNGTSIAMLNMPFNSNNSAGAGKTKDYSGHGNNGTVDGATWSATAGFDGKGAYSFTGTNGEYIDAGNVPGINGASALSVEAWVYVNAFSGDNGIVAKRVAGVGEGFQLISYDSGGNHFHWYPETTGTNNVASSVKNKVINTWYHVVGTYDGSYARIYVNGVLEDTQVVTGTIISSAASIWIGNYYSTDHPFDGKIDSIRIYNRALSPAQIKALYNNRTDLIVAEETKSKETWKACITPNDGYGDGPTNCSNNLTINTAPTVVLAGPANNSVWNIPPTFSWTYSDSDNDVQQEYHIIMDNDSDFSSPEINSTVVSSNNYTQIMPNNPGSYYWKVQVYDGKEWSNFSGTRKFTTTCLSPYNDMYINSNTKLCSGTFHINDSYPDGVLILNASDIILDCNNATLIGNGANYGIYVNQKNNITIKNCILKNYNYGIYSWYSNNSKIINNKFSNSTIYLSSSHYFNIISNYISASGKLIDLEGSRHTNIFNNKISKNLSIDLFTGSGSGGQIYAYHSPYTYALNNTFKYSGGIRFSWSDNSSAVNNTVTDFSTAFAGLIGVDGSNGILFEGNNITNTMGLLGALYADGSKNVIIKRNKVENNLLMMLTITNCNNITVRDNNLMSNKDAWYIKNISAIYEEITNQTFPTSLGIDGSSSFLMTLLQQLFSHVESGAFNISGGNITGVNLDAMSLLKILGPVYSTNVNNMTLVSNNLTFDSFKIMANLRANKVDVKRDDVSFGAAVAYIEGSDNIIENNSFIFNNSGVSIHSYGNVTDIENNRLNIILGSFALQGNSNRVYHNKMAIEKSGIDLNSHTNTTIENSTAVNGKVFSMNILGNNNVASNNDVLIKDLNINITTHGNNVDLKKLSINNLTIALVIVGGSNNTIESNNAKYHNAKLWIRSDATDYTKIHDTVFDYNFVSSIGLMNANKTTVKNNVLTMENAGFGLDIIHDAFYSTNITRLIFGGVGLISSNNNTIVNNSFIGNSPTASISLTPANAKNNTISIIYTLLLAMHNSTNNYFANNTIVNNTISESLASLFSPSLGNKLSIQKPGILIDSDNNKIFSNKVYNSGNFDAWINGTNNSFRLNSFLSNGIGGKKSFYGSYSPMHYNGEYFNDTYGFVVIGSGIQVVTVDNTLITPANGTNNYDLMLFNDTVGALGNGTGKMSTAFCIGCYAGGIINCSALDAALSSPGACRYYKHNALVGQGAGQDYLFNDIFNSTYYVIHSYTSPPSINLKDFSNNYCVAGEGNFYEESIPMSRIGSNDCGLSNLTSPTAGNYNDGTVKINWTRQSAMSTVTYDILLNRTWTGVETLLARTVGLNYLWNTTGYEPGIYSIRLVPWIVGSRHNATNAKSEEFDLNGTIPATPLLISPANDSTLIDRTPTMNWTTVAGSGITYQLLVDNDTSFASPEINVTISDTNYTPLTDMKFGTHNWKVRAYRGVLYSSFSTQRNFTIITSISCSLPVAAINFGNIDKDAIKNTQSENPAPMIVRNNGNLKLNISINSTDLWKSQPNPSSYYQFRIDKNESNAWDSALNDSWHNLVKTTPLVAISGLKYHSESNSAEIELQITGPPDEGAGSKKSQLNVWCSQDE